jgi:hypothetical protein
LFKPEGSENFQHSNDPQKRRRKAKGVDTQEPTITTPINSNQLSTFRIDYLLLNFVFGEIGMFEN